MKDYKFDFKSDRELFKFIFTHDYYGPAEKDTIEGYLADLRKVYHPLLDERNRINYAVEQLKEYGIGCDDNYRTVMSYLDSKAAEFKKHIDLCNKYIEEKQDECKHDFHDDGHDSHHTYYVCNKCGLEETD
jgi:hypothetical protein